jgi:hypothetical protein
MKALMKVFRTLAGALPALAMMALGQQASAQNFSDWSPPINLGPTINSNLFDG